jgi:hypothetical protein
MLQFFGTQPPAPLNTLRPGGTCPHCGRSASFTRMLDLIENVAKSWRVSEVMVTYHCDACLRPVPVLYDVIDWDPPRVRNARIAIPVQEPFEFQHVPEPVAAPVREALSCLSVGATNGFAALCRRAAKAVHTELGLGGDERVGEHVREMVSSSGLGGEWEELALAVYGPSDDRLPALPAIDQAQAKVLLSLLQDLVYQFFTRPGKVRRAAGGSSAG